MHNVKSKASSVGEMKYKVNAYKPTDAFNKEGLCAACQFSFVKDNKIDWDKREKELIELCNKYRSKSRSEYDCIPEAEAKIADLQVIYLKKNMA